MSKKSPFPLMLITFSVLVGALLACEPLAPPEQAPRYVVVTGQSPAAPNTPLVAATASQPVNAAPSAVSASGSGVVNTPIPTATPTPIPTALPTATPFVCHETVGQVFRASFYSNVVGAEVPYQIYLPPCFYDTLQRYPYVVLLHGTGYGDTMWVDLGAPDVMDRGVSKGTLPPMVLVMPDGGAISELNDQPDDASYETVILDELLPAVERDFCLWGNRDGRAIGGISRGGFWAFSIALRHPDLFSALGGHSPHFQPDNAGPETNPLDLAASVNLDKFPLRVYIDHAANDYVGTFAARMAEILRERGVVLEYIINPTGEHDPAYWSAHVADYLAFYGQAWPMDVAQLPSCLEPSPQ